MFDLALLTIDRAVRGSRRDDSSYVTATDLVVDGGVGQVQPQLK
jgi:hypothetical protein